jgi:hypothetical protein
MTLSRWICWAGVLALVLFYLQVAMWVMHPRVSSLYRLYYIEKSLREWNHGKVQRTPWVRRWFRQALPYLSRQGWGFAEDWGTWSDGPVAQIHLSIPDLSLARRLSLEVNPFVAPHKGVVLQTVRVFANDAALGERSLQAAQTLEFDIPPAVARAGPGLLSLRFEFPRAASPALLGLSPDTRRLGLGFVRLSVN